MAGSMAATHIEELVNMASFVALALPGPMTAEIISLCGQRLQEAKEESTVLGYQLQAAKKHGTTLESSLQTARTNQARLESELRAAKDKIRRLESELQTIRTSNTRLELFVRTVKAKNVFLESQLSAPALGTYYSKNESNVAVKDTKRHTKHC
ncbi:hypothetical protein F4809DRAFT_638434 [Biscogniauxia mediterranea]|nr:hypothetical protein F4809DRAFT_638434 [Biscogniauxia mediterranea]